MFTPSLPLLKQAYGQRAIGKLDIISKPLHGPHIWHILAFENLG